MADKVARIFLAKNNIGKCSICSEYLSVEPITMADNKPVCGRCPQVTGLQAFFYEELAQYMFFPCKNDIHGCDVILTWGTVLHHEMICKFTPFICPAISCKDKVEKKYLIQHFLSKHEDLLMTKNQFKVPGEPGDENECINKLFIWKSKPFIVKIDYSAPCCFFNILGLDDSKDEKLVYNLFVKDGGKQKGLIIKNVCVSDYRIKHHDHLTMTKLDVDVIREFCSGKISCTFYIEHSGLPNEAKNVLNNDLLAELECPICAEYMKPPIFMCDIGHALCNTCKPGVVVCPICQLSMSHNRNFALEKITEHISYPCKFNDEGCVYSGKLPDINSHESKCAMANTIDTLCYVSYYLQCDWKGPTSEQISHISSKHPNCFIDHKKIIELELKDNNQMRGFLESNGHIFKLTISYKNMMVSYRNMILRICMIDIANYGKATERYRFHIDFEDLNERKRILSFNNDCIVSKADDENIKDSSVIPFSLIKPFVKQNMIRFRINIMQI